MDGEIIAREAPIQRLRNTSKQLRSDFIAISDSIDEQAINGMSAEQKAQNKML